MSWEWVVFAACAFIVLGAFSLLAFAVLLLIGRWIIGLFRRPKTTSVAPVAATLVKSEPESLIDRIDEERAARAKQVASGFSALMDHLESETRETARMRALATSAGADIDKALASKPEPAAAPNA